MSDGILQIDHKHILISFIVERFNKCLVVARVDSPHLTPALLCFWFLPPSLGTDAYHAMMFIFKFQLVLQVQSLLIPNTVAHFAHIFIVDESLSQRLVLDGFVL